MKSKGKRIIGILFSLALMFAMTPVLGLSLTAYAGDPPVNYNLWVGGTQVTSANKDDVLKGTENEGKVSYTPAKDGAPAKLTLNGANITTGIDNYGIYYSGKDPLNIVLADGSVNTIEKIEENGLANGIFVDDSSSDPAGLAISGKGKLTVSGGHYGICANYSEVSISGSTVTAIGGGDGIYAYSGIDIIDSTVTTEGGDGIYVDGNVNISGGNVNATGYYSGIYAEGSVTINSGNIEAEGRYGITGELVTINDGTVNATGMNNKLHPSGMSTMKAADPAGIWADGAVEIKGGKVIAAGDGHGILAFGLVKNHIDGTGWTDKAGTAGKTAIAINTDGQDLAAYKKVQFPAKVDPEPTPTPTPTPSKVSGTATAKMSAKGKTGMTLAWNKIQGAAGYDIYLARCDAKGKHSVLKKVKTIEGNKTFKWTKTGLKKGKSYKACVKAFVYKNGKKSYVKTSPVLHAYSGNVMGKYTNAKSIKVNKTKVVLNQGKAFKVKAKVTKVKKNKKLMPKKHVKTVRYMTTNKNVATVSASGKITAKGKGSCTVIAFAHNGISKSIKVTVK